MGIVCHLTNGSESRVHRAGRYITVTQPMNFVVVRDTKQLAYLALRATWMGAVDQGFESEVRL